MMLSRRLFVVPLADNDHGKSTMIRAMVSQGLGRAIGHHRKKQRDLVSPFGRPIDAYVFGRSYQEVEKEVHRSVVAALDANDPDWRKRELIVMPSHVASGDLQDVTDMMDAAHAAGFDVVSAAIIFTLGGTDNRSALSPFWKLPWDMRWTIPNPHRHDGWEGQAYALGVDLWVWICSALAAR